MDDALVRILEVAASGAKELDLSGLQLANLPEEIAMLTRLTSLDLSRNRRTDMPVAIFCLTNLTSLNLFGNRLTDVPEAIYRLPNLIELELSMNQLTSVPEAITRLTNLTSLNLSHDQLTEVPEAIARLTGLTSLRLNHNQLTKAPEGLARLTNLRWLDLRDNQLRTSPETLEHWQDAPLILRYLTETRSVAPKRPLAEAKMVVVGQGGVGKTSLVKMLVEGKCERNERKTEGIDIRRWPIKVREESMRLNVWDFGGQEILHATHQFFLTKRSLYLLVIDARQGEREGRVEY